MDLAESHGLRGYEAAHVAAAIALQAIRDATGLLPLTRRSADVAQLAVAATQGLEVDNPNAHH